MSARPIPPRFVPKIWGSTKLSPWFPDQPEKIGEVWFPAGELLIKFLFTTEKLSVQVHPDDEYAREHENSLGKTEMWHILRADPGAQVALGFREPVDPMDLPELCRSGEVMDRLAWHTARPGDTFFVKAGSVHAIGEGLALCEIQQNSDVTYRMFDYGRPRELHLERALDVAECECHPGAAQPKLLENGREELVRSQHFTVERVVLAAPLEIAGGGYAIVLEGSGTIDGQVFQPGTVWETGTGPGGGNVACNVSCNPDSAGVLLLTRA